MAKKGPKKSTKKEERISYVKVDQPSHLRKNILETAIESAELLKKWESYQKIKEEKAEIFKKLVVVMNKIEKETNSLKKHLPKSEDIKVKERKKEKVSIKEEEKEHKFGLDREIDDIHSKLRKLKLS